MSERDALIAGRYRLVNRLGSGGMGIVWEAWDERLRRPVAVKQLHPQLGLTTAQAELANSRAMREARITARLHHPHAVPVFDVVEHDGQPCLIMQYLPSESLHTLINERGRLAPTEVVRIGAEVAAALAAAHRVGIVHRDVKPGNVLIAEDGSAKITDFGISHALGDVTLTSTGMVTGTPAYLAPEVARGAESTFASDVFSLGATLYAAVEGVPPFGTHDNPMALLHQVAAGRVTPPTHAGPLTPLLVQMLAADPEDRPPMDQMARALQAVDTDPQATVEEQLPAPVAAAATQVMASPPHLAGPAARGVPLSTGGPPTEPAPAEPPPAEPPPGRPLTEPAPDDEGERRRSRLGLAVVAAAVALALAIILGIQLFGRGDPGAAAQPTPSGSTSTTTPSSSTASPSTAPPTAAPSTATASQPPPPPPSPTPPPPSPTPTPSPPTPTPSPTPTPTPTPSPTPTPTPTPSPPPTTPPPPTATGTPTGAQLAQAVTDYYGLLPGNTDAGWSRLTARYQSTTARNRQTYDAFWAPVARIAVSGATGSPPGAVRATVTYSYKDGRTVRELTSFGLVNDGGVLKIDSSSVLSSQ